MWPAEWVQLEVNLTSGLSGGTEEKYGLCEGFYE